MSDTPPFAWQDKRVLRLIREQIEHYGTALSVYNALAVAASDAGKHEFQTTHAWLSQLCGFCERTVRSRLADLQRIGAITIGTPTLKAPSTYRLMSIGSGYQTFGTSCRTFGKGKPPVLPGSEETKEKKEEDDRLSTPNGPRPDPVPHDFTALRRQITLET